MKIFGRELRPGTVPTKSERIIQLHKALDSRERGDLVCSEKAFRQSIRADPDYWLSRYNYGTLLNEMGRFAEAEEQLRRALLLNSSDAESLYSLGYSLFRQSRLSEARDALQSVIADSPDMSDARELLGYIHLNLGAYADAIVEFENARRFRPLNEKSEVALGILYGTVGRHEDAFSFLSRLPVLEMDDPTGGLGLASACENTARFDEALKLYEHLASKWPNLAEVYSGMSRTLGSLGREDDADKAMARAEQLHGSSGEVK